MTSSRILFPQFRDEQASSKYPFADAATLTSESTGLQIDPALFVDASFFCIGGSVGTYISSITITAEEAVIVIGDNANANKLTGYCSVTAPPANGVITFKDNYGRPCGILLAEKTIDGKSPLNILSSWSPGTHLFTQEATEFVASVSIPSNEPGVRGLTVESGSLHTRDVLIVGRAGVVLRYEEETNSIRVDVVGVPLFKRLICEPQTTFPTKKYLRSINGCAADEYGNFTFTATDVGVERPAIRIYPDKNALNFNTLGPQVT